MGALLHAVQGLAVTGAVGGWGTAGLTLRHPTTFHTGSTCVVEDELADVFVLSFLQAKVEGHLCIGITAALTLLRAVTRTVSEGDTLCRALGDTSWEAHVEEHPVFLSAGFRIKALSFALGIYLSRLLVTVILAAHRPAALHTVTDEALVVLLTLVRVDPVDVARFADGVGIDVTLFIAAGGVRTVAYSVSLHFTV